MAADISQIILSPKQQTGHDMIMDWYKSVTTGHFKLAGVAGSGKTSIASKLKAGLGNISVAYATYTGKASSVLRGKLKELGLLDTVSYIGTIHSMIYNVEEDKDGNLTWTRRDELGFDLIIVDEASMVSLEVAKDIESYGIPVLYIGDHAQLPPVDGKGVGLTEADYTLTEIHRQAEGNPIIRFSRDIREGVRLRVPNGMYDPEGKVRVLKGAARDEEINRVSANFDCTSDIFLCYTNNTRQGINSKVRQDLGYGNIPQVGDQVICLRNNKIQKIYNGMIGNIESFRVEFDSAIEMDIYRTVVRFSDGFLYRGKMLPQQFGLNKTVDKIMKKIAQAYHIRYGAYVGQPIDLFDFAYCVTCHKSQGSEFQNVYVFIETGGRMPEGSDEFRRWLYTAVTRATDRLTLFF